MTRWRPPQLAEPQLVLALALLIGIFAGLAVVCFRVAIEAAALSLTGTGLTPSPGRLFLILPVAGVAVSALVELTSPAIRGSGVNQTKAAVYIYDGYIAFRTVIGKFVASALAIGSGFSLGPEDPSLHMGAGIASRIGRASGLSRDALRMIAPVGAAAGLSAAFNSPITAVLFVIEEVIGTWSAMALGAVVLASASSVVIAHWFLGYRPLFRVAEYHVTEGTELLVYAVLGLLGGLVAVAFVELSIALRGRLRRSGVAGRWVAPGAAGVLVATIAIWFPQVAGVGYEHVDNAMHGQFSWELLGALAIAKLLATSVSFASGVPGGLFAPTLFMGAMLGGAVRGAVASAFPGLQGEVGLYALVGMGTMFAGILRAPITSVFMIVEVSGNYSIVLPVIVSNMAAYLVSRSFTRESIFDMVTRQDGVLLPSMEQRREAVLRRVEDALAPAPLVLAADMSVATACRLIQEAGGGPVVAHVRPGTWGEVPAGAVERLAAEGKEALAVGSALGAATPLPTLYPDESLEVAFSTIGGHAVVPVVHRADRDRLIGVVSMATLVAAVTRATAAGRAAAPRRLE